MVANKCFAGSRCRAWWGLCAALVYVT